MFKGIRKGYLIAILIVCFIPDAIRAQILAPQIVIGDVEFSYSISGLSTSDTNTLTVGDSVYLLLSDSTSLTIPLTLNSPTSIVLETPIISDSIKVNPIPLWWSFLPPLLSILLALIIREVITSLFLGIFLGAVIIQAYSHNLLSGIFIGFMSTIDTYLLGALNDTGHLSIIVFSLLIGAMVSIISKNGGMQGVVNRISKNANSPKSGQLATWFLGVAIFFDDYANTLIVGNTMRPITDRLKISREKLAYLVDSTAAPIAAIAFVTTWIGAELGYIQDGIEEIDGLNEGVYSTFIQSLAYSYYPILALLFMLMLILKNRDFGPMYRAEMAARKSTNIRHISEDNEELDEFKAEENISIKAYNAVIPIVVVIFGTIGGLIYTGWDPEITQNSSLSFGKKLSAIIGNADSYLALLWSSLAGLIVAMKLSVFQKILGLGKTINAALNGIKTMLPAIIILVLAWGLALVIEEMHTADLLTSVISDNVSPYAIPAITFLLAAIVAFSTGSSWGTMAILYPLMLPLSWSVSLEYGLEYGDNLSIFHNVVASVLAGAVLGDHCSPISDTTILSSMASSCNHIQHVKTQMPYALTVGFVSLLFGVLPASFGIPFFICLPLAAVVLYLIIQYFGKRVDTKQ